MHSSQTGITHHCPPRFSQAALGPVTNSTVVPVRLRALANVYMLSRVLAPLLTMCIPVTNKIIVLVRLCVLVNVRMLSRVLALFLTVCIPTGTLVGVNLEGGEWESHCIHGGRVRRMAVTQMLSSHAHDSCLYDSHT